MPSISESGQFKIVAWVTKSENLRFGRGFDCVHGKRVSPEPKELGMRVKSMPFLCACIFD